LLRRGSADWNRMAGDERVRFCPECKLNIYNFSEMSDADIENILSHRNGRLCARFYQACGRNHVDAELSPGASRCSAASFGFREHGIGSSDKRRQDIGVGHAQTA
jgi:hypothetical protein